MTTEKMRFLKRLTLFCVISLLVIFSVSVMINYERVKLEQRTIVLGMINEHVLTLSSFNHCTEFAVTPELVKQCENDRAVSNKVIQREDYKSLKLLLITANRNAWLVATNDEAFEKVYHESTKALAKLYTEEPNATMLGQSPLEIIKRVKKSPTLDVAIKNVFNDVVGFFLVFTSDFNSLREPL